MEENINYRKVYIKGISDLPKEQRLYFVHYKSSISIGAEFYDMRGGRHHGYESCNEFWLDMIDWYLQPLPKQTEKDCVNCPSNQFYLANTEKIMNEQERVKSTERQTSEEFAKMKDGSFVQIGCIDTVRDLWVNINCDNHIDPATCKRETSCDKCDKYKVVYTDEAIEHRACELAKIHSKQSVGDFTVGYLFGIKEPIKFKNY